MPCLRSPKLYLIAQACACLQTSSSSPQVSHLRAERDVLNAVRHPFLVRLVAHFQDTLCVYFIMEFVCGGEFFRHLKNHGK